ncbi:hypothetical protein CRG98_002070 [Punica granatum]|uniref:Uncharacterized protein n=1 Tax=Punica granatum TaxID=22663 RepID=A0A2I0L9U4_PUNGR|nr:hypothetical protein CRG98_002070 [Punica granatum]
MATDQEISQALQAVLRESAGPKTTFSDVVQQLQSKLGGLDLSHKLDFIRSQIQLLFQPPPPQQHQQQKDHHHPFALPQQNPKPAKESAQVKGKRKGGAGGLNKLCSVSPELQAIVGQPAMPRTEIVKQLWAYIRKNNLQDPNNKRKIICNDELRIVFETDCTDMFKMNKLLAKHISPLEPTKESQLKKQKVGAESTDDPSVQISEALASFFGVSEREMPRSDITKRIWEYINVNQLQVVG